MEGGEVTRGVFLEEHLLSSMLHKERDESCTPIGQFETSPPADSVVGPMKKCVMEAELPQFSSTKDNPQQVGSSGSLELGQRPSVCSGPSCPPGFEDYVCEMGLNIRSQVQDGSMEFLEGVKSLEDGEVDSLSCEVSNSSCTNSTEKGPQTPVLESSVFVHCDAIEVVLPFDEELVEAQNTWNVGKALGLKLSNELAMVEALSKVRECQDFSMPTRRRRPKKNKGGANV